MFTVTSSAVVDLDILPYYGRIENWKDTTWFIVGGVDAAATRAELLPVTDGGGTQPPEKTLKIVIYDETAGRTYTIPKYAFDHPKNEIYGDCSYLRIAVCEYGVVPVSGHTYTVTVEVYKNGSLTAKGTSPKGALRAQ